METGDTSHESVPAEAADAVLSQRHLETIFHATQDMILVLDGETQRILYANDVAFTLLGYEARHLLHRPFQDLLAGECNDSLDTAQLVDGVYGPFCIPRADGSLCSVDLSVAVIPWDGIPALLYTMRDVTERTRIEEERDRLIRELREALATVKQLSGLLPICASCKRIRDDQGYWSSVEQYLSAHAEVQFSHGICPQCREALYPELRERPVDRNG